MASMIASKTLSGIVDKLSSAYQSMRLGFFTFGDQINALREHGYSWNMVQGLLRDRFPHAKAEIRLDFSLAWIQAAAEAARLFLKDGGLVSPDGKHRVSREEFASLGLSDAARASVVAAIKASLSLADGLPKLRVSDVAAAVKASGDKRVAAVAKLMSQVDTVNRGKAAMLDPVELTHMLIAQLNDKIDKAEKNLEELRNKRSELKRSLPPVVKADKADKAAAGKSTAPANNKGKGRNAPSSGAPVQA